MSDVKIIGVQPGGPGSGWNRGRVIFLAISAGLIVALMVAVREVLLPFVLALIIAYVLTPLVVLCERARIPRSLSIILVYLVTFGGIYMSIAAIAPRVYDETVALTREAPRLSKEISTKWGPAIEKRVQQLLEQVDTGGSEPEAAVPPAGSAGVIPQPVGSAASEPALVIHPRGDGSFEVELGSGIDVVQEGKGRWRLTAHDPPPEKFRVSQLLADGVEQTVGFVKQNALELIKVGQAIVSTVSRGIFLLFMTLMVAGYVMHTRDEIIGFFRTLPPQRSRASFDRLLHRIDRGLAGVVRGQLLICLVNGVLSAIGFWLFGLKYWPILAIIAGVMSIIPIFGSILSTIPAVLVGLTQDFWTALWVLLWIIGIHQIEANLLNPKIIGVAAKIHPVLVVFSLIAGEHFFGLWGALLAVPVLSLSQAVFMHFRYESMPDSGPDSLIPTPPPGDADPPSSRPVPSSPRA